MYKVAYVQHDRYPWSIPHLRDELNKEYAATPEREFISDTYGNAYSAITELAESILKLGSYNIRMSLSL